MNKLEKIDVNFRVETNMDMQNVCFYSIQQKPFQVYGLLFENGKYRRMPESIAQSVSEGVHYLHSNTSGGRLRFRTNSRYIAITAQRCNVGQMDHFPLTGTACFDLYAGNGNEQKFVTTFRTSLDVKDGYQSSYDFGDSKLQDITINFPLYTDITEVLIGLEKDAVIEESIPYSNKKPWVFYGSSITQGGCASRPGNAYPAILSRHYNVDFINLGFAGSGKGEQAMADYIARLDMEMFFLDYDYNAPDVEHLLRTHSKMFKTVRMTHPDVPIILMTAVTMRRNRKERANVIYQTYLSAKENGDQNVYFWDGMTEFAPYEEFGTVEGCHPNDHGFVGMAQSLCKTIDTILHVNR